VNTTAALAALPPLTETDTYIFWSANEGAGWMHLLPPLAGRRLLCIDASGAVAWALARECREVTVLHWAPHWPDSGHAPSRNVPNLSSASLDQLLREVQAPGFARYDGLVIHDPQGTRLHEHALAGITRLLGDGAPWLAPDGWIYLGARNPGSLQRWRDRLRRTVDLQPPPLPARTLPRLLKGAGAREIKVYPYLMVNGRVAEVLPRSGYRATKNREAQSERLKEWFFGARLAPRLAPAVGMVAFREPATTSTLDALVQRIGRLRSSAHPGGSAPVMKQYLVFAGHKAIIAAGPPEHDEADVVAVLTADAVSVRGRSIEAPQLDALARIPAVAALVPRLLDRFSVDGARCFVMERIPGVTLDQDVPPLERVSEAAHEFLLLLHRETAVPTAMDEAGFDRLALPVLRAAQERNPEFGSLIGAWQAPLRLALREHTLPAVYQHGDYKVENVIYEPESCRLLSVIDWEHARRPGLPLLDLLYLLAYNRVIRGAHWTEAIEALIVRAEWNAVERRRLEQYMQAFALDESLLPALRALFLAHHIGCRIHLPTDGALHDKVSGMLVQLTRVLHDRPVVRMRPAAPHGVQEAVAP
jgi:aminoglycoside phosphotransferase (APT) family kinase protein